MSVFRFKRFSVENVNSAMKVNTDGVILGAAMTLRQSDRHLLDVGTGTGTIALMAAQRLSDIYDSGCVSEDRPVEIDAIDIDEASAHEASANFAASPWKDLLSAWHCPLSSFEGSGYDLIFSNPPYFDCSLLAPEQRRCNARHSVELSFREIVEYAADRLNPDGRLSLVLPADQEKELLRYTRMCGLHLFRLLRIRTVPHKAPSRIVAEFARCRCSAHAEETLIIQEKGKYTDEYLSLTSEFYLFA